MSARHQLFIRTPEGIVFSQVLAGPVSRAVAWIVDMLIIGTAISICQMILMALDAVTPGVGVTLFILAYFIVSIGYFMFFEWRWRGQTLGKRLMRVRVVDAEGMRLQFNQVVIRNLLRFVDDLPALYFIGGLVCWFNGRSQRLGDIAANTVVIRLPKVGQPDLSQLLAGKFNSLRLYPHLAARLRQQVDPAEAAIALQAIMRRDEFDPVARVLLFGELARHFSAKVEFPADVVDGLADEQFIRNVVDVVYRPRVETGTARANASMMS